MIAATSALAQAFEQSHSKMFDLSSAAPSTRVYAEYRTDPVGFCVDKLGIPEYRIRWSLNAGYATHPWDGTVDPLVVMLEAVAENMNVCVEAATGTQKSYTCACLVLWFLACWEGAIVKTFAGSEEQLRSYMWKEIRTLWPAFQVLFPGAVLLDLEIRMRGGQDNTWGAAGVSVRKRAGEEVSVAAQGMHAPHMLLLYEETPGIEMPVIVAGENTCTAPHNLRVAVGNPDHQLDTLHQFGFTKFGRPHEGMRCIRISAHDHPNVVCDDADIVPGAASRKSVASRLAKYTAEGRLYKSRVRGLSPEQALEALIEMKWVRAAQQKWADQETRAILERVGHGKRSLGVDVANSEAGDQAAIAYGLGAVCQRVDAFPCPNANNLGFKVHLYMQEHGLEDEHVGVDGVGVGAGCVNELMRFEHYVRNIKGGVEGALELTEDWNNIRSQAHWQLRVDLSAGEIALPDDEEMVQDLITPQWEARNSKICVESKEDLKERLGGRSPNKGDAIVYWNFVRPRSPVVSERPQKQPTVRERIMHELQKMDEPPEPKKYYGVLRQG